MSTPADSPGSQHRLLLLHGFLSGGHAWQGLRRELAPDVVTFAPDLLGYGRDPRRAGTYSLDALVDDLEPLVEREQPTHVLGHSMGAIVALALARRYPGGFAGVGLAGLPVFDGRADGLACLNRHGPTHRFLLHNDRLTHAACAAIRPTRRLWEPLAPLVVPARVLPRLRVLFEHSRQGHAEGLDGIVFAGLVDVLAEGLCTPVAALHGGLDRLAPLERVRDAASRHGWDLRVAPTGNHQLPIERPRTVAGWVHEQVLQTTAVR